ncbi:MAG: hypothetical protein WCA08_14120 [Desulfoferrobacter sp.]
MAKKRELSCLIKRDLLNQPVVSVENLLSWGQQYEGYGLLHDAVEFYEKAQAKEALFRLLKIAQEEGDTFLFKRINRILKREPSKEELLSLAKQAEGLGKKSFAAEAYMQLGMENPEEQPSVTT